MKPQGVWGVRDPEKVMDIMLDKISEESDPDKIKSMKETMKYFMQHDDMIYIPAGSETFDWDENIHGKF